MQENLTDRYHQQALNQATIQFWISALVALVGFGWIIYASTMINLDQIGSVLKILAGVITDAAALLSLRQATKTRQRATEFYDRLRKDHQQAQAIALANAIEDPQLRSRIQAQLALYMAGSQPLPIELSTLIAQQNLKSAPSRLADNPPPAPGGPDGY